jgi:hypothetical protein
MIEEGSSYKNNYPSTGEVAKKMPEIPDALSTLSQELSYLCSVIDRIEDKLRPISRPTSDTKEPGRPSRQFNSDIARSISELTELLYRQQSRLTQLLQLIEL